MQAKVATAGRVKAMNLDGIGYSAKRRNAVTVTAIKAGHARCGRKSRMRKSKMIDRELLQQAHFVIKDFLLCVDEDCGVTNCDECKPYRHAWDVEKMIRERLAQPEQEEMRQTPEMIARATKAAHGIKEKE